MSLVKRYSALLGSEIPYANPRVPAPIRHRIVPLSLSLTVRIMMRSTFFSAGLFILLWGVAFLFVDKVELSVKDDKPQQQQTGFRGFFSRVTTTNEKKQKVIDPPEWAAFSLLSIGTVTMLYAVALPKKKQNE